MKLPSVHRIRSSRREYGVAVIVILALLAILMIYVAGNLRTLDHLEREVQLLERKQILRLQATARPASSAVEAPGESRGLRPPSPVSATAEGAPPAGEGRVREDHERTGSENSLPAAPPAANDPPQVRGTADPSTPESPP